MTELFVFKNDEVCYIKVPDITLHNAISIVTEMWLLLPFKKCIFDFSEAGEYTPVAMLYLSNEILNFKNARSMSEFSIVGYKNATYAAHMGFFRAFGAQFGRSVGEASGGVSYLPITIHSCSKIKWNALEYNLPVGEYIDKYIAKSMAKVLVNDEHSNAFEVLTYCIREMLRNVIEHSESTHVAYCAQYWPTKSKASLAILDRGIGIRTSLEANPHLTIEDDLEAIRLSLQAAISGKMFKGRKKNHNDVWQNSGYGLCITSEICRRHGSFFIGSGEAGIELGVEKEYNHSLLVSGTLINMDIDTSDIARLEALTYEISTKAGAKVSKPSRASLQSF